MSESDDDDVPGVRFRLRDFGKSVTKDGTLIVKIMLTGEAPNEEVLQAVHGRLSADGLKVYAAEDFGDAINNALRKENAALERRAREIERAYRALQEEARKMREALSVLDSNLGFSEQ